MLATQDSPTALTHTTVRFDDEADHCRYDLATILGAFAGADLDRVRTHFAHINSSAGEQPSSLDLYLAAEALSEQGYDDLATTVAQFNHHEHLYGCACRREAFERFWDEVGTLLSGVRDRFSQIVWVANGVVYTDAMDAALEATAGRCDDWNESVTLDEHGNITVVTATTTRRLVAFAGREVSGYLEYLDLYSEDVDYWVGLDEPVRTLMATMHHHDIFVARSPATRATELEMVELEQVAADIAALPPSIVEVVGRLIGRSSACLDELVATATACHV